MLSLRFLVPVVLVVCALPSRAATDLVSMTVSGLKCSNTGSSPTTISLDSWAWGTANPTAASGAGMLALNQLTVTKVFDVCSPDMLDLYLTESKLGTVTLTQARSTGNGTNPVLAEVVLTNAWFASYRVGGSQISPASETWALSFDKICVTTNTQNPDGSVKQGTPVCYPGS
jgi:type VI protein secretion system component Hcp